MGNDSQWNRDRISMTPMDDDSNWRAAGRGQNEYYDRPGRRAGQYRDDQYRSDSGSYRDRQSQGDQYGQYSGQDRYDSSRSYQSRGSQGQYDPSRNSQGQSYQGQSDWSRNSQGQNSQGQSDWSRNSQGQYDNQWNDQYGNSDVDSRRYRTARRFEDDRYRRDMMDRNNDQFYSDEYRGGRGSSVPNEYYDYDRSRGYSGNESYYGGRRGSESRWDSGDRGSSSRWNRGGDTSNNDRSYSGQSSRMDNDYYDRGERSGGRGSQYRSNDYYSGQSRMDSGDYDRGGRGSGQYRSSNDYYSGQSRGNSSDYYDRGERSGGRGGQYRSNDSYYNYDNDRSSDRFNYRNDRRSANDFSGYPQQGSRSADHYRGEPVQRYGRDTWPSSESGANWQGWRDYNNVAETPSMMGGEDGSRWSR